MGSTSADRHPIVILGSLVLAICGTGWLASVGVPPDTGPASTVIVPYVEAPPVADADSEHEVGRFVKRNEEEAAPLDDVAALEAIGYLSGSTEATDNIGVTVHDESRAFQGFNLYTSGHRPETVLMDMDGEVLHTWALSFEDTWPNWLGPKNMNMTFWRRVRLMPNGDLLAIFEGLGLVRLDKDSNILWKRPNQAHHDLDILPNGDIVVLSRRVERVKEVEAEKPTLVDHLLILDADGMEKDRVSLLRAYYDSHYPGHWRNRARAGGDVFHTNSVQVLDGRLKHPAFRKGNVLVSMRHLNTIAVVDLDAKKVVWSRRGEWKMQHDPQVLDNGNILLFDNGFAPEKNSEVLEFSPVDLEMAWRYTESPDQPFFSATCGTAQRLPNGNTVVTESDNGRAFEVTPEGEIVWAFYNPNRPADQPDLVATLFENLRLTPDFPMDWLEGEAEAEDGTPTEAGVP